MLNILDFGTRPPALRTPTTRSMLDHVNSVFLHYPREQLNGTPYHITVIMQHECQRLVIELAFCVHVPWKIQSIHQWIISVETKDLFQY